MSAEVCFLSLTELATRVREKKLSASEVTDAFLSRIANLDEKLGTFLHVDEAGTKAQAKNVDDDLAKGKDLGPERIRIGVSNLSFRPGWQYRRAGRVGGVSAVCPAVVKHLGLRWGPGEGDGGRLGGQAQVGENLPDGLSLGEQGGDFALAMAFGADQQIVGEHPF